MDAIRQDLRFEHSWDQSAQAFAVATPAFRRFDNSLRHQTIKIVGLDWIVWITKHLIHAVGKEDELVSFRIVVNAEVVPPNAIAIPMTSHHLHGHEGKKAVEINQFTQTLPAFAEVRFLGGRRGGFEVRPIGWAPSRYALHLFSHLSSAFHVVEITVRFSEVHGQKVFGDALLQDVKAEFALV